MRYLGVIFVLFGLWATSWGIWACYNRKRPIDLLGTALAPIGTLLAVLGGVLILVPQFFSGC